DLLDHAVARCSARRDALAILLCMTGNGAFVKEVALGNRFVCFQQPERCALSALVDDDPFRFDVFSRPIKHATHLSVRKPAKTQFQQLPALLAKKNVKCIEDVPSLYIVTLSFEAEMQPSLIHESLSL